LSSSTSERSVESGSRHAIEPDVHHEIGSGKAAKVAESAESTHNHAPERKADAGRDGETATSLQRTTESTPRRRSLDGDSQREVVDARVAKPKDEAEIPRRDPKSLVGKSDEPHPDAANIKRVPCDKEPCPAPPKDGAIRRAICEEGPCMTCPPGSSPGRFGTCVAHSTPPPGLPPAPAAPPKYGPRYSPPEYGPPLIVRRRVSDLECQVNCSLFATEAATITAELRMLQIEERDACRPSPASPACSSAQMRHQAKLLEYSMLLARTPVRCQGLMPPYVSFL
jgi:hypothetical protein